MTRQINRAGLDLIKDYEGLRLTAYPDPGTGGAPYTVGFGHTGPDVTPRTKITKDKAEELLIADLATAERTVESLVKVPLTDNQFAALVSFVFNCGAANFRSSTLLRRLNDGDYSCVPMQLARWNRATGKVLPGLTRRRAAEAVLWGKP